MKQTFMGRRFNIHYYATNLFGLLLVINIVTLLFTSVHRPLTHVIIDYTKFGTQLLTMQPPSIAEFITRNS